MSPLKTALAASVILATLGLAGCQTTEERVYYSSPAPVARTTYVYDEGPVVYRRPAAVYVAPPPVRYVRPMPPPVRYVQPMPRHHVVAPPRYYGAPRPYYGTPRPSYGPRRPYTGTNGNAPGYDTQ